MSEHVSAGEQRSAPLIGYAHLRECDRGVDPVEEMAKLSSDYEARNIQQENKCDEYRRSEDQYDERAEYNRSATHIDRAVPVPL